MACQPFPHKTLDDDETAGPSGAATLSTFSDVDKLPAQSVTSLKAKVTNLSPKKPVRGGASYFRIAGLQDVKGAVNAVNLFGEVSDEVEAGKVTTEIG